MASNYIIDAVIELKDKMSSTLEKVNNKLEQNHRKINKFANALNKASRNVTTLGKNMTTYLTAPIVALGTASIVAYANFENAMLGVKNVTGATGEELKQLEDLALSMSMSTSKSAVECANGIEYLGLAGWETSEIMQNYAEILRLSEATSIDLATASDLVTDSLSTLGKNADFTTEYVNKLAIANGSANATAQEFMEAINNCGGMASQLGLDIDELVASLGVMANRGTKGAEAGTALNAIFVNLLGTTSTTSGALKELGVTAFDTQGNFVGWENLLDNLSVAMASCTEEQEAMIAAALGGKTRLDDLIKLLRGYTDEYDALKDSIADIYVTDEFGNQLTILEQMQQDYQNTLIGQFEILKSQIGYIFIDIGKVINENFGGVLSGINEQLEKFINWFSGLSEEQKATAVKIAGFVAAIGPLLLIGGKISSSLANGIKAFNGFYNAMKNAGGFIALFKSSLGLLQLKIILVIAAIALLVYGIYRLIKWWGSLNDEQKEAYKTLGKIIGVIFGVATAIIGGIVAFSKLSKSFSAVMSAMKLLNPTVLIVIAVIVALGLAIYALIKYWPQISEFCKKIRDKFKEVCEKVSAWFSALWESIKAVWNGIVETISTCFSVIWDTIVTILANIWDNICGCFNNIYTFFCDIFETITSFFVEQWDAIKQIFSGVVDFIVGIFTGDWERAWQGVVDIFDGIWRCLKNMVKTPLNFIIDGVNALIRGLNGLSSFEMPDWLGGGQISLFTIPEIPKLFTGTHNWGGGLAMIHDKGAEIVDLPNGSRVYPHDTSLKMSYEAGAKSRGNSNITLNIQSVIVREEADVKKVAKALVGELKKAKLNHA